MSIITVTKTKGVTGVKFNKTLKQSIVQYILEKIADGQEQLSRHVAEAFDININTVHTYINELLQDKIIERKGRDKYELVTETYGCSFSRSAGELKDETLILDKAVMPYVEKLPENVKKIWQYASSEMINNVIDHSEAEHLGIIVQQNYLQTTVHIVDDGIGIFKKIKDYFHLDSLDDAVIELSKGKLTTDDKHHSGEGIFFTSRIMDEFFIYSDNKVYFFNKYREEIKKDVETGVKRATYVLLTLSNFSKKHLLDVFDSYTTSDGDFSKTAIPVKNILGSSPISRSQAKRVCSRLENFKEVEIDFSDVEFIGQGFAHEMFVVFANEHPEIKLVPTNMNEDVKKMYRHVLS